MKIFLDSVGCRLNQSEIETFARQFRAAGHEIVQNAADADLVVVNTCTVTSAAASDSRQKIRQAAQKGVNQIVATGCWATLEPGQAGNLPSVKSVIANSGKDNLVASVLGVPPSDFDIEPLARDPLPGIHWRTRAFIKAQDGCDNFCTYCITRLARGRGRSLSIPAVMAEVHSAVSGGTREIVLTGVHLGSWGKDQGGLSLRDLIAAILQDSDIERVRLSSIEPWDLGEDFFRLWENPRLCRNFHLPLQSGAENTLKRMGRNTTPSKYRQLVEMARGLVPGAAITTDLIVGFPGETETDFNESMIFVEEMAFAGGHVFSYSLREGTAAAHLGDFVNGKIVRERNNAIRTVLNTSAERYQQGFIGQEVNVLWESTDGYSPSGWRMHGLSGNYLRVEGISPERIWNKISRVKVVALKGNGMMGEILDTG